MTGIRVFYITNAKNYCSEVKQSVSDKMSKKIALGGFVAVALVFLVFGAMQPVSAAFTKKAQIHINNIGGSAQTYYQVPLNITYDSDMNNDFSDIRVKNESSGEFVPYWIENKVNGSWCKLWFNATYIPPNSWCNDTYYLYYGNLSASDASDGDATFEFFDDFNSNNLNDSKWSVVQGTVEIMQSFTSGATEWWFKPVGLYYNETTYIIYIETDGLLRIAKYDHTIKKWSKPVTLHDFATNDDHCMGSLWVLSDGRILAAYAEHGGKLYYRRTINPEDITLWEDETILETDSSSYAQLTQLNDGTIILFYRYAISEGNYEIGAWRTSTDDGATWSNRQTIIDLGNYRTYGYIASDGQAVHIVFCYNDGNMMQDIYHAYSPDGGTTWKRLSDGATISLPLNTTNADLVYETNTSGSRITDFILDENGYPVILFDDDINTDNSVLKRVIWDGSQWRFSTVGSLLRFRNDSSASYQSSGALDPKNKNKVIIAEKADDVAEIREYEFNGTTWNLVNQYTTNSTHPNVRPRFIYNYTNDLRFINFQIVKYADYYDWSGYLKCYPSCCPFFLVLIGTSDVRGIIESKKSFSYPLVIESLSKFSSKDQTSQHPCGMRKSLDSAEKAGDMFTKPSENILTCQVRKDNITNEVDVHVEDLRSWRKYTIKWKGGESEFYYDDTLLTSLTGATLTDQVAFLVEGTIDGELCYIDWLRVRKYADPEPLVSIGSENVRITFSSNPEGATIEVIK